MSAWDGSGSPLPERSHALASGPLPETALTIAQRAIPGPRPVERHSRPEPAAGWTRPKRPRSGWHAYRAEAGARMPSWAVELALTIERPLSSSGDTAPAARTLLLARAAGPWQPVRSALSAAIREVDSIAGVGPSLPRLGLVRSHPEPCLDPVPRPGVLAHLRGASERGRQVGHRRGRTHEPSVVAWRPGAGVVLTCTGRVGVSAQAVVAFAGHGDLSHLRPPPGGAVVLRAWRCHRTRKPRGPFTELDWALTAGVVLASSSGSGLGRVARRYAVLAQDAGWNAAVLTGAASLGLARAGDPRYPPPRATARYASRDAVMEMLMTCLVAAVDRRAHPALACD